MNFSTSCGGVWEREKKRENTLWGRAGKVEEDIERDEGNDGDGDGTRKLRGRGKQSPTYIYIFMPSPFWLGDYRRRNSPHLDGVFGAVRNCKKRNAVREGEKG